MKLIVLYGANNLGKTTQVTKLSERMNNEGLLTTTVKYPVYDLEPTGPLINQISRHFDTLSLEDQSTYRDEAEIQRLCAENRMDFQPRLLSMLHDSYVIAENYTGTGLAWGISGGVPLAKLEHMHQGVHPADIQILLDGDQFTGSIESGHQYEENSERWNRGREAHAQLAEMYGWKTIDANQDIETVHEDIYSYVMDQLFQGET